MTMTPGVWLGDLTWPEAKSRFDAGAVVVVPIGAGSKEHGHHLPLYTDSLLLGEIVSRVETTITDDVLVKPLMWLGNSDHHLEAYYEDVKAVWEERFEKKIRFFRARLRRCRGGPLPRRLI